MIGEKLCWDETKADKYYDELQQMWETKREVKNLEERWDRLIFNVKEAANKTGMIRKIYEGDFYVGKPEQIDEEGIQQKKVVCECLKKYRKTKSDSDREQLRIEKNKLKSIYTRVKNEKRKEKWKKVDDSRNTEDFWKAIGEFRKKKEKRLIKYEKISGKIIFITY